MKNKLLLKGKRRSKIKICLGMLNINIWKSGRTEEKKNLVLEVLPARCQYENKIKQ